MNIDHQALYRPLTKWTARLSKSNFEETMTKAFQIALSETPGPVHVGLPSNIDGEIMEAASAVGRVAGEGAPAPDPARLDEAAQYMRKAKKPILAIGLSAARLGVHEAIRRFVDKNSIPVVLTPMAKGIVPDSHPWYGGVVFHARSDLVAAVYRQADLVIGLGYDPIEFNYESWMPNVPLVHIDTRPADIAPGYDVACDVAGDLAQAVVYLNTLSLPAYSWDVHEIEANKQVLFQALRPRSDRFTPSDAVSVLQEALPRDGIITGDVGSHLHLLGQLWKADEPNRFIMTNGWSSMGFGIPSAIGAKLCRPSQTVVCVTGDGGFLMNCGELVTARRLGLDVVVVVLCDRSLNLIEVKQGWRNLPSYGVALYEGEYFGADVFLGVPVLKGRDRGEMKAALQTAFGAKGPVIIEAPIDGSVYHELITRSYK